MLFSWQVVALSRICDTDERSGKITSQMMQSSAGPKSVDETAQDLGVENDAICQ